MFYRFIPLIFAIFMSCNFSGNSYHRFSTYQKCNDIEKGLVSKYGEPDVVQKSPHLIFYKWYLKDKTIIFQKLISGSCNLRTLKNGG